MLLKVWHTIFFRGSPFMFPSVGRSLDISEERWGARLVKAPSLISLTTQKTSRFGTSLGEIPSIILSTTTVKLRFDRETRASAAAC